MILHPLFIKKYLNKYRIFDHMRRGTIVGFKRYGKDSLSTRIKRTIITAVRKAKNGNKTIQ